MQEDWDKETWLIVVNEPQEVNIELILKFLKEKNFIYRKLEYDSDTPVFQVILNKEETLKGTIIDKIGIKIFKDVAIYGI